jgi:PhnB protein
MGNGNALMATDALESMGQSLTFGNNSYITVATGSEEETEKFFNKLSDGGKIQMPLNKTFWGVYCGMCLDQFGVQWIITYDVNLISGK